MSDAFAGLLALGIFLGYFLVAGTIYSLLPVHWGDSRPPYDNVPEAPLLFFGL